LPVLSPNLESDLASLKEQLYKECAAMAKFALASGKKIPLGTIEIIQKYVTEPKSDPDKAEAKNPPNLQNVKQLVNIHEKLARIILPATPRAVLMLEIESSKPSCFKFLGAYPLIRRLMLAAIISLFIFIGVSLSPEVNNTGGAGDILQSSGFPLLLNLTLYIAAAGLGASFAALFLANKYIVAGTFEPKYDSSYWIRFTLGLIAGMVLAVIIPVSQKTDSSLQSMGKPLLAMLGGFSSSLVFRILTRLLESVESLVTGGKTEAVEAKEKEMTARLTAEDLRNRSELASDLFKVLQETASSTDPEEIKAKFNDLQKKISLGDGDGDGGQG
jgi:hypothetical protein